MQGVEKFFFFLFQYKMESEVYEVNDLNLIGKVKRKSEFKT